MQSIGADVERASDSGHSGFGNTSDFEKERVAELENSHTNELEIIHTNERVATHAQYYEKDGLRTEGDGEDHDGSHQKVRQALHTNALATREKLLT